MKKTLLTIAFLLLGALTTIYSQSCGTSFTDPAGPTTNYANNSDYTVTICPSNPGDAVTVTFTSFDLETNYDALYVFNGNSISSPQIASTNAAANVPGGLAGGYWGSTVPGPFTSSSPDGCLTFRFRSDNTANRIGWIADVICAPAPICLAPSSPTVSTITPTSATLSWTENSGSTSWEVFALPCGSLAPSSSSVGLIATTNPYTVTGLTSDTCYNFYVRANCAAGDHSLMCPFSTTRTSIASPACGGLFVDDGGSSGSYANNSNNTYIICPNNPGDGVIVTFTSFLTESGYDAMYVFNGNSVSAPQFASSNTAANVPGGLAGGYWGTAIPGPFTSSSSDGCLTFLFRSGATGTSYGWVANVTCGPQPTCTKPSVLTLTNITSNSVTLGWTQHSNPGTSITAAWQCLALPAGSLAPTAATTGWVDASTNPFTISGLSYSTCYDFYVRAVCSASDVSEWSAFKTGCTSIAPPACGGVFVDNGGPGNNYGGNSYNSYVVCPTNPGDVVNVSFVSFDTQINQDALYVFDGNWISAPQIPSTNPGGNVPGGLAGGFWGTAIPGPFTSSSPDGCLTFLFRSDALGNRPGWVANVNCVQPPDRLLLVAFLDYNNNGIKDSYLEPLFSNGSFIYQQNGDGINVNGYSPTGQFALYDTNPVNNYAFSYQVQSGFTGHYDSGTTTYNNISIPTGGGSQTLYFPITSTNIYSDISISINPLTPPRPGSTYINKITYKNQGFGPPNSGTITFVKPTGVTTVTTSQTGTVANGTGFTYAFTNLTLNESRSFLVSMTVPALPTVSIGDLLTDTVSISTPLDDINLTNNSNSNAQIVVNSYGLNDKLESHGKSIPINQFAQDDYFFYTIRFDNEATSEVVDVTLEDVLDSQINAESVLMVSASHNYTLKRVDNHLIWDFKNIHLPAFNGNTGYVQFKAKLNPGFHAGTIIPNTASIYFDTNPTIQTNTFSTKFTIPLGVGTFDANSLALYPNPTKDKVTISNSNANDKIASVVIYEASGKRIYTLDKNTLSDINVDVSNFARGFYLVELTSESNTKITKKLLLK